MKWIKKLFGLKTEKQCAILPMFISCFQSSLYPIIIAMNTDDLKNGTPKPEYILCSAIWYKELPLKRPDILVEAEILPVNVKTGMVFCGWRHGNCMYSMMAVTGLRSVESECGKYIQGFLTSNNRFVDRFEALQIAKERGQVLNENNLTGNQLYSEDVW